jgi:hypothetical protein
MRTLVVIDPAARLARLQRYQLGSLRAEAIAHRRKLGASLMSQAPWINESSALAKMALSFASSGTCPRFRIDWAARPMSILPREGANRASAAAVGVHSPFANRWRAKASRASEPSGVQALVRTPARFGQCAAGVFLAFPTG